MTTPKSPDAGEPVEPHPESRIAWAAPLPATAVTGLHIRTIVTWPGNEWLRGYLYPDERSARERKRGERPNPVSFVSDATFLGATVTRFCAEHFEAGMRYADSGDSDELAKLRAEVADVRQAYTQALEHGHAESDVKNQINHELISMTGQRDAEKARADRAEQSLAELRAETAENFVRTFDYWQEAASELSRVTQRGAAEHAALEALRGQLRFERESGTQAKERIAELEKESENRQRHRLLAELSAQGYAKELAEAREVSAALVEQLRGLSAAHTSTVRDLRDRDHELSLANARGNRLQAQLTEANGRVDTLLTERQQLEIEMAEARGELRRITESDFAHQIRLSRAVGDVKTTEVTIAALHAWRAKTSAAQSPSAKECNGPGCSYPDGCPKCNPLGTPTQSPSSADSDARECPDCYDGSACLPGGCGIDSCERCGKMCPTCNGSHELPASPPYETAPTLEKGVSNCEACNGDGDNGFFGTCLECGGEGVVRVESAPADDGPPRNEEWEAAADRAVDALGEACAKANEERARARGYYANCDLGDDKRACYLKGYSAALTPLLEALLWIAGNAEVELTDCCVRIVSPEGEFVGEHDGSEDAFVAAIVQTHWKAREARR